MKLFILLLIACIGLGFCVGAMYENKEPIIITRIDTHTQYIERIVPQEIIVERDVERVVVREVIMQVPREINEFKDLEELKEWAEVNSMSLVMGLHENWDCDDYAEGMRERAMAQGYIMSICPVYLGKVFDKQVEPVRWNVPAHMGNITMIGNDIYYIEPQTGKVVWVLYRD